MLNHLSQPKPKLFIDCQSHKQRNAPDKVNPRPPNLGKGRDLDKSIRESAVMFLPSGQFFNSSVLASLCLRVKAYTNFIKNIRAGERASE